MPVVVAVQGKSTLLNALLQEQRALTGGRLLQHNDVAAAASIMINLLRGLQC